MSKKLSKQFSLNHNMNQVVTRNINGRVQRVTESIGVLFIDGTCYCDTTVPKAEPNQRYDYDLDLVMFKGVNVLPILEHFDNLDSLHGIIMKAVATKFDGEPEPDEDVEVGRIAPAVTGCNERKGSLLPVLRIFDPLNNILNSYKTN